MGRKHGNLRHLTVKSQSTAPHLQHRHDRTSLMVSNTSIENVFERQWVLEQIGGDEELLHEIAQVFLADSPEIRQQLREALDSGDLHALHAAAHCAKSAVGNFGAQKAVAAALLLEETAKAGDASQASPLTDSLCFALIEVENALRQETA
jgi:HPt (histidine-containing phosphotransfer) domain-containing protein